MPHKQLAGRSMLRSRRSLLIGGGAVIAAGAIASGLIFKPSTSAAGSEILVYKTPTCGCCGAWVRHLSDAGLNPRTINQRDLTATRKKFGAPANLASCHIAVADGYVVEGHVPADAIKKLLAERPEAVGIFIPGMPLGSPGMESPYGSQAYDVILLRRDGSREIFASYAA